MDIPVDGTHEQTPRDLYGPHSGKDTERDLFVPEKVWCTKAYLFLPDRKSIFVWNTVDFFLISGIELGKGFLFEESSSEHLLLFLCVNLKANIMSLETSIWPWFVVQTDFQRT